MKLLKGRKLLTQPKALINPRIRWIGRLKSLIGFFRIRKLALFNLIITMGVVIYCINYLLQREDTKALQVEADTKLEEQGEEIKQEFFETVYEDELEAERVAIEQEERRQKLIEQAGEGQEIVFEEASTQRIEELEEMTAEEEYVQVPVAAISNSIDEGNANDWAVYENSTYKYKIEYPPSWFIDGQTNENAWLAYITEYDPAGISRETRPLTVRVEILVQENYRGLSLDDWINQKHLLLGEPSDAERRKIGGVDAVVEQIREIEDVTEVVGLRNNYVYTISFIGDNIFELNHINVFNHILDKFRFIDNVENND